MGAMVRESRRDSQPRLSDWKDGSGAKHVEDVVASSRRAGIPRTTAPGYAVASPTTDYRLPITEQELQCPEKQCA